MTTNVNIKETINWCELWVPFTICVRYNRRVILLYNLYLRTYTSTRDGNWSLSFKCTENSALSPATEPFKPKSLTSDSCLLHHNILFKWETKQELHYKKLKRTCIWQRDLKLWQLQTFNPCVDYPSATCKIIHIRSIEMSLTINYYLLGEFILGT